MACILPSTSACTFDRGSACTSKFELQLVNATSFELPSTTHSRPAHSNRWRPPHRPPPPPPPTPRSPTLRLRLQRRAEPGPGSWWRQWQWRSGQEKLLMQGKQKGIHSKDLHRAMCLWCYRVHYFTIKTGNSNLDV